jgi:hypothetical protein
VRVKVLIGLLPAILLFSGVAAQSDPGINSARAHGLAGIGMTLGGIDAVYSNPAGLTSLERTTVHVGSARSFGLSPLTQGNAAIAIGTGKDNKLFMRVGQFGFDAYQERQIGLGYAMQFSDQLSAALRFDVYQLSIEGYGSAMLPGFLVGVQYRLGSTLSFGITARNAIEIATHEEITLPTVLAIGMAYHPSERATLYAEVEKDIDFSPRIRIAVEYDIIEALIVRVGAAGNPGTFHAGVGLRIRQNLRIDLGAGYHTLLGFTPAIGIVFASS